MFFTNSACTQGKYRNIIFDLGGVLLTWEPKQFISEIFKDESSLPWELVSSVGTSLWLDYDAGKLSRANLIEEFSSFYDRDQFSFFESSLSSYMKPILPVVELACELKKQGYKLYILSNMPKEIYEELCLFYDFFSLFDGQTISSHARAIKPHPQIYHKLLADHGLEAKECLFIDDREENIQGSIRCGIDGIIYRDAAQLRSELEKLASL